MGLSMCNAIGTDEGREASKKTLGRRSWCGCCSATVVGGAWMVVVAAVVGVAVIVTATAPAIAIATTVAVERLSLGWQAADSVSAAVAVGAIAEAGPEPEVVAAVVAVAVDSHFAVLVCILLPSFEHCLGHLW
jgi:hypothetical protein